jgi:hypothetical protein
MSHAAAVSWCVTIAALSADANIFLHNRASGYPAYQSWLLIWLGCHLKTNTMAAVVGAPPDQPDLRSDMVHIAVQVTVNHTPTPQFISETSCSHYTLPMQLLLSAACFDQTFHERCPLFLPAMPS